MAIDLPRPLPPGASAPRSDRGFRWVPVRSLGPSHRGRIEKHLLALSEEDRYLRFGMPASDDRIVAYVRGIDFQRDEVFGIFDRRLELVAMAHLAYAPLEGGESHPMAEFAVSVRAKSRGRGYGARLFEHAIMHARNRGIHRILIHALSENLPMLKIARKGGAKVQRSGGEADAWVTLAPDDIASNLEEFIEEHAAELNFRLKQQARFLGSLVERVTQAQPDSGDSTDQ